MRFVLALALVPALLAGCTDIIPVKDDFGVSALQLNGNIPPEYRRFNNYDPSVDPLLAEQMCATNYVPLDEKEMPAAPGEIVAWRARCEPYTLHIGRVSTDGAP
jgi:hypothetical protein